LKRLPKCFSAASLLCRSLFHLLPTFNVVKKLKYLILFVEFTQIRTGGSLSFVKKMSKRKEHSDYK